MAFNNPKKILAIGPHPDDLEIGCFGTLLKYKEKGAEIVLCILTDGAENGDSAIRRAESEESANILGAKIFFGNYPDGSIVHNNETTAFVEKIINEHSPDLILIPNGKDTHQDHINTHKICLSASRNQQNILIYETLSSTRFNPNLFVNVTKEVETKIKCLLKHKSQIRDENIAKESLKTSLKSHSYKLNNPKNYFEAFEVLRIIDQ